MCLLLYVGTDVPLKRESLGNLAVHDVPAGREEALTAVLNVPHVSLLSHPDSCSCDFPSVMADGPFDYFDGMFDDDAESRSSAISAIRELRTLLHRVGKSAVLFPMWDEAQVAEPLGWIELQVDEINPERFFFVQDFIYTVSAARPGGG